MANPVSLEDAKRQLRIELDDDSQDDEINGFILDAAAWVENYTGHILDAREVTETFRGFRPVTMRAWPIDAAAVPGVAYTNSSGSPIALTGVRLDISTGRARILPSVGSFWPFVDSNQLFTVTVRAGYEEGDDVPRNLRRAMLILISGYDEDREGGDVFAAAEKSAQRLCTSFKRHVL